jgi:Transcriptional regulators
VIAAARLSAGQLAAVQAAGVPLVLFNREAPDGLGDSVCCAFAQGEARLVDALVAAGHRRFGLIAGPADSSVGEARMAGAIDRLAQAGLAPLGLERGDFGHASGRACARALVEAHGVDAIIAANDGMALGALDALRSDLGLRVPEQVSVVGFDGVGPAAWPAYALTTMRQPIGAMAEATVDLLMARIAEPGRAAEQRRFAGELVVGRSARLG